MCSKQNRRFKSKCVQHDYRNKWIETLTKNISCKCKYGFDSRKFNSNQKWNNNKCQCECKNPKTLYVQKRLYLESCYI